MWILDRQMILATHETGALVLSIREAMSAHENVQRRAHADRLTTDGACPICSREIASDTARSKARTGSTSSTSHACDANGLGPGLSPHTRRWRACMFGAPTAVWRPVPPPSSKSGSNSRSSHGRAARSITDRASVLEIGYRVFFCASAVFGGRDLQRPPVVTRYVAAAARHEAMSAKGAVAEL
jgi:hypothetical protein